MSHSGHWYEPKRSPPAVLQPKWDLEWQRQREEREGEGESPGLRGFLAKAVQPVQDLSEQAHVNHALSPSQRAAKIGPLFVLFRFRSDLGFRFFSSEVRSGQA